MGNNLTEEHILGYIIFGYVILGMQGEREVRDTLEKQADFVMS